MYPFTSKKKLSFQSKTCPYSWRFLLVFLYVIAVLEIILIVFSGRLLSAPTSFNDYSQDLTPEAFLQQYAEYCQQQSIEANQTDGITTPQCPCVPENLVGQMNISLVDLSRNDTKLAEMPRGGAWRPRDCSARQQVAIIVPFRDREDHLRIFLHHMHPILQRQMLSYVILVIEQSKPSVFNKAQMMNIGFLEAVRMANFDCFVFHDVDMIAEDDRNFYTCGPKPRHVAAYCGKWNYTIPYDTLFGGATAFTRLQFERANGFSTEYFGWGGEDDDMYRRVRWSSSGITRYPASVAKYTMIKHKSDKRNPYNAKSGSSWSYRPHLYSKDGLSSMNYSIVANEKRPLYRWILAAIPFPSRSHLLHRHDHVW